MIHTMPTVSRMASSWRWVPTAGSYLAGSLLGGLILGTSAAVGSLLFAGVGPPGGDRVLALSMTFILIACALVDARLLRHPRIQRNAQVPESWRWRFSPKVTGLLYGAMLGTGLLTKITFASFYACIAMALLSANWLQAMIIGLVYGGFRALPIIAVIPALTTTAKQEACTLKVAARYDLVRLAGVACMLVIAAWMSVGAYHGAFGWL